MAYLNASDLDNDPVFSTWVEQAQSAMNDGADPLKVNAKLRSMLAKRGYDVNTIHTPIASNDDPEDPTTKAVKDYWSTPFVTKHTKQEYKEAVTPSIMKDINTQPNSPAPFANVESGGKSVNPMGFLDSAAQVAGSTFNKGVSGLLDLSGSIAGLAGDDAAAQEAFSMADEKAKRQKFFDSLNAQSTNVPSKGGSIAGGLLGGAAAGMGVGNVASVAREDLEANKRPMEAFADTALEGEKLGLQFMVPGAGKALGWAGRTALGAAATPAIGAAADIAHNTYSDEKRDPFDVTSRGLEAVMGGIGSAGAKWSEGSIEAKINAAKEGKTSIPETGNEAFDAGVKQYEKFHTNPEQTDLFTKNNEGQVQGDLFGAEPVEGSTAEARRAAGVAPEEIRTPEQKAELEKNYIFDQQERLDKQASAVQNPPKDLNSVTEPQAPDLWNVGVPDPEGLTNQLLRGVPDRQVIGQSDIGRFESGLDAQPGTDMVPYSDDIRGYQESAPNPAMLEAFRAAQLRRASGMKAENLYPDVAHNTGQPPLPEVRPTQPEVFNPSSNPIVEQTAKQGSLPIDTQGELFAQPSQPAVRTRGQAGVVVPVEVTSDASASLKAMLAKEQAKGKAANPARIAKLKAAIEKPLPAPTIARSVAPAALLIKRQQGTLTTRDILQHYSKDLQTATPAAREAAAGVKYVEQLSDKLGGGDTPFEILDEHNPAHAEVLDRSKNELAKGFSAFYDPKTNKVYVKQSTIGGNTMLHEAVHGITSKMLYMGRNNLLDGAGQAAFTRLDHVFENVIKPELSSRAEAFKGNDILHEMHTYGLTNLDEFYSEFFSNGVFRNSLKDLKLEGDWAKNLPPVGRGLIMRAKNVYDLAVKGLSKVMGKITHSDLGMADKASNGFEVMFSHMDDLHNKLSERDTRLSRESNSRGISQPPADMSFLGEQVPFRAPEEREGLVRPHGPIEAKVRNMFMSKGNRPEVRAASDSVRNARAGDRYQAITLSNLYDTVKDKVNPADVYTALTDPSNKEAGLAAVRKQSPELADRLQTEMTKREGQSEKLASLIESDPNVTPADKEHAQTIRNKGEDYLRTGYAINNVPNYADRLLTNAKRGNPAAVKTVDEAKAFLKAKWLPDIVDLATTSGKRLDELYDMHVGKSPSAMFDGLSKEDKATEMRHEIADKIDKIDNPEQWADTAIKDALNVNKDSYLGKFYDTVQHGAGIGSKKGDMPEQIAALRGRIDNPVHRLMMTIEEQGRQIAELQSQHQLRNEGLDKGLFTTKADTATHTVKIQGEQYGPLRNLYTTPDIAKSMEGVEKAQNALSTMYDYWGKLTGLNKAMEIVANPGNIVVNAVGGPVQMVANGNFNPKFAARGMRASAKIIASGLRKSADADVDYLIRNGFTEFSQTSELQAHGHGTAIASMMEQAAKQDNPMAWLMKNGGETLRLYNDVYGNADLWSKFANVFKEKDFWTEQHPEWDEAQLTSFIKKRIDNTNITPSNVSPVFKHLDKSGVGFITKYFANVYKNIAYNTAYGLQDAAAGIRTGNGALFQHGLGRLVGAPAATVFTTSVFGGIAKQGAKAFGLNAEDPDQTRQSYMNKGDISAASSNIIISDPNAPEAGEATVDVDRPNPYGPISQPAMRLVEAWKKSQDGDKQGAEEALKIAGNDITGLLTNNTLIKKLTKAVAGTEPALARNAPTAYNTAQEIGINNLGLTKENTDRMLNILAIGTPKAVGNYLAGQEVADSKIKGLASSGIGVRPFSAGKDIQNYLGREMNKDMTSARKPYTDLLKSNIIVNPDRIDTQFRDNMKKLVAPYDKMVAGIEAAKAQGMPEDQIAAKVFYSGIPKQVVGMVLAKQPIPFAMMMQNPQSALINAIKAEDDPVKKQKLIDQAPAKMEIFGKLIQKYADVTMDQLRNE